MLKEVEQRGPAAPALEQLRWMVATGEALPPDLCTQWLKAYPGIPMMNAYGPTECSDDVTHHPIDRAPGADMVRMPIGRPVDNINIFILNHRQQPAPIGIAGEIYVAGVGVGRGYLNDPERTADVFVPDSLKAEAGNRLYRTGDLARRLANGDIEYLGRIDQQVKIRGFRIELAEIESALGQHPEVKECAVVMRQSPNGDRSLLAYVVPYQQKATIRSGELRAFLRKTLPEYMIPSQFSSLEEMPLTSNGKLDRKSLPAPRQSRGDLGSYVAPRNLVEQAMTEIWSQVLQVDRVGIHDNFFALGGHSLLATQLLSRIRRVLNVEVPLRKLFEFPTIGELAPSERDLQSDQGREITAIERAPRNGPLPLSFAQERLWFLDQFEPGSSFYSIPMALRFTGSLDIDALHWALNEVERRHESLRTVFASSEGKPFQRILEPGGVEIQVTEMGEIAEPDPERRIQEAVLREAQRGFNLAQGPLMRVSLIRLSDREHLLLIVMHHIICDAWSIGLLVREMSLLYRVYLTGEQPELEELPVQYADYALWQRGWLQGAVLERQLDYWRQKLDGQGGVLELPSDRPRPAIQSYRGARVRQKISAEVTSELWRMSREEGATLFMLLLAAFEVLLYRYTGKENICVGTPIAGRHRFETESVVGLFVNTLVMRVDLSGDPSFSELVGQVRDVVIGAFSNQDVPFERLVEELNPERSMSHSPLFQVMFVLQNAEIPTPQLPDLRVDPLPSDTATSKFDLTLGVFEGQQELECSFEYNTDLFDASTIERLASHYETLLRSIVRNPEQRVSRLDYISEAERSELLYKWSEYQEFPNVPCIHRFVEQQAEQTPEATAVSCNGSSLAYGELNQRANKLAHYLRKLGVGPDVLVGIVTERSAEMIIGLLGILKAGGAYVPIDPAYPQQRIAFMLKDANISVLLTQRALLESLPGSQATVVCLDSDWERIEAETAENPSSEVCAENLAYVIYTSGSTGKPKGVLVTHANVVRLLTATQGWFKFAASDVWTLFHSYAFDFSVWEIWGALMYGGRLVIVPYLVSRSPQAVHQLLSDEGVTILNQTPSAFHQLMQVDEAAPEVELPALRFVIFGGEALDIKSLRPWFERHGDKPRLVNMYGITETTVHVTLRALCTEDCEEGGRSSIGVPISDMQFYMLDQHLQPAPLNVAAEIYVGGAGVSRGYLNRPELTAERFIPDPFGGQAGRRLYKTGDLARRLANGDVEYLGRIDQQVKIRGFRIELAEIESALGQHPQVKECAVVMGEDPNGNSALLAYVVPDAQKAAIRLGELRAFLKQTLPEYMIPTQFVSLAEMPLTANGKLDRKALPAPRPSRGDLESYVAPRNLVEQAMTEIWSQVLHVDRVGVHDNFFALGGHSLLATQLLSRLRHVLKVEVPLRKLFELPTIGELAQLIERDLPSAQGEEITAIERASRNGPLPLSFAQERLWFLDQFEPGSSFYSIPMALRFTGSLDIDALHWALNEVEQRHESLRTVFANSEEGPAQRVLEPRGVEIEAAELGEIAGPDAERRLQAAVLQEAQRGFNLALGPLLRVSLLRVSDQEHLLTIVMHHIICDAWSLGLLVREISLLYRAYLTGERPELEELPVQYADYALWQRDWLQGAVLERQLDYWKQQLDGSRAVLELPSDRPRPAIQSYRGARVRQEIPAAVTSELQRMSREEGATLFMLLLAGFEVLLYRYTAKEDICVGTPIAGRNRFETESVVGLFVNTLVMRVDLSGEPSFSELVGRVRDVVIGAFSNQDVPFEKLVEELNPERSMSHSPLFQVMFAYQTAEIAMPHLPDLRVDPLPIDTATSKFDLSLDVYEGQQELVCSFEYNTDLFDPSTIERLASHYQTLLEAIVTDPNRRISNLPLLSESEQQQLVSGWNDTEREYAHGLCVNEWFEAQAEANPDDVAVAFENLTITYGELNARSNQVAHFLRELGVGPDKLVGIYLERSIDVLIAVFGVLKAGGAYVPLDAAYPKDRLALLVEDSRLTTVLTQHHLSAQLPSFVQHAVCLDRDWQAICGYSQESPPQVATPDNLAYAVYTSGSTGKPKGVMISHRSLANAFQAWRESYGLGSDCNSHLQMASISFDVFAGDLVRALCSGGTLILCPREFLLEPEKLYELMLRQRVDSAEFVPAVVRQLVAYVAERGLSLNFMKLLVVGSDIWNVWEFEQLKSYCGDTTRVINSYGVSEATVDSSYFESTQIQLAPGGLVPIGRPFGNTSLHVLDSKFRLAPVGVPGELCIGGLGLARGYLNQPDLTAEKFVANPFCKNGGSRLYRTGDCVRRLADGTIEFLGRLDNQIKIRGFRIELGEIEAALSEHDGVRESVVMAREAGPGNQILVAYIVPQPGQSTGAAELRRFLKESLPEHMIPSAFVEMERMPLSANGKLDRRALPEPRAVRPHLEQAFVAPRNSIEETINAIWVEVLKIDRIGVNDSFFDLGGHSLLATQVASRLRKAFEIDIPLRSLFENPTIAELGQTVDTVITNGQHGELKSITPAPRDKPLQLSFAQERLWFLDRLQPGTPFYNMPSAVRLLGKVDIPALERSLAEVARRHEVLRTTFPTGDGHPTLLISPAQPMSLPVIDINGLPALERETRARQLINEEVMRPFDLESGPLLRVVLLRFAEQDHVLVFTTHHIVSDGWSMDVLVREAVTLYEAFLSNRPSPLADLAIQYTDFAAWQREWMRGEVLDAHLDYWKKQLSGAPLRLRLPTDRPRSSAQNYQGKRLTLPLSQSLLGPLKELTGQSGTTLFMGLLAAFKTLLYRYTGQDDIVVGTAIAGRGRAEIESLIGFFINMLVMRTSLSGTPKFVDLLSRVKETALGAYAHQDLPFEKLVEVLQPQRDPGVSPLFQVAFGLQNTPVPQIQLPGLEVRSVAVEEETVRFDLTLWIWELTDGLTAAWTYSTDLFNESTIIRMHQHYDALLLDIVAHPEERVNALQMLTEAERKQRVVDEEQSHDLKLETLRTSKRTAIAISAADRA
ncbi:MAG TPA: amino acid adenylation domain-containing protein [Pyrinomonadaceae bacterium]|nr:amino acid adenylation domain-containing protein [Pyrinomonadaceae bacterium]